MSLNNDEYTPINAGKDAPKESDSGQKSRNIVAVVVIIIVIVLLAVALGVWIVPAFVVVEESLERPMYLQTGITANPLALCNNGEPATWHFRESLPGPNENKWIIRFEGGNACFDNNTCYTRWNDDPEFMKPAPTEEILQDPDGGVLNGDPERNPEYHDYNAIHMHYCSSDSWMGNNAVGEGDNDSPWQFRGYNIVLGIFDELKAKPEYGFAQAEDVIVAGYSAGGLSVVSIADAVHDKILEAAPDSNVYHICDSGWFMISADEACGELMDCETYNNCPLATQFEKGFTFWGTNKTLNPACLASGLTYECTAPEFSFEFLRQDVKDSLLLIESQYDQMNHDLHVADGCNMTEEEEDDYWAYLQQCLEDSLEISQIENYLCTRCSNHDTTPKDWWYDILMLEDDRSVNDWVTGWLFYGDQVAKWEDECDGLDCNPTCPVHVPPAHVD